MENNNLNLVGISLAAIVIICIGVLMGPKPEVQVGMTPDKLQSVVGQAVKIERDGDTTALQYQQREFIGIGWRTTDYVVILRDDKVLDYGPGTIDRLPSGKLTIKKNNE